MPTIILKRSTTAGTVPTNAQLQTGEVAVNTADGYLYTEHSDTEVKRIGTTADRVMVTASDTFPGGNLQTVLGNISAAADDGVIFSLIFGET